MIFVELNDCHLNVSGRYFVWGNLTISRALVNKLRVKTLWHQISWWVETARLDVKFSYCSEFWQTLRQCYCRDTCHISDWSDNYKPISRSFKISRDLLVRRLTAQWRETPVGYTIFWRHYVNITAVDALLTSHWIAHDDVIKWKHFPRYWPFVRGFHRSPVNSPHKGLWRWVLRFSSICAWINGCVNNRGAGDVLI